MFKNSKPIDKKTHINWFDSIVSNKNHHFYIGEINNSKIGVVRFDCNYREKKSLVFNLNPRLRGQGLSAKLLSLSIKKFFSIISCPCMQLSKKIILKVKNFYQVIFFPIKTVDVYRFILFARYIDMQIKLVFCKVRN